VARQLSLGARVRRQPPRKRAPMRLRGLTAQRGSSKGGHHAINTEVRLGLPGQSKSARYKMMRAAEHHCLHYWAWHAAVHSDRDPGSTRSVRREAGSMSLT